MWIQAHLNPVLNSPNLISENCIGLSKYMDGVKEGTDLARKPSLEFTQEYQDTKAIKNWTHLQIQDGHKTFYFIVLPRHCLC